MERSRGRCRDRGRSWTGTEGGVEIRLGARIGVEAGTGVFAEIGIGAGTGLGARTGVGVGKEEVAGTR